MEIIEIAGKRFRVPVIGNENIVTKKPPKMAERGVFNEEKWAEKNEEVMECRLGKVGKKEERRKREPSSDSGSGDDDILAYWLHGNVPEKEKPKPVLDFETGGGSKIDIEQPLELSTHKSSSTVEQIAEQYSHVLTIPLYDCQNVKKRVEAFRKKLIDGTPIFNRYFNTQKLHLPILYLKLDADQEDTLTQILGIPDIITKDKKKPKVEVQSLNYFCNDNSKNPKRANCLFTTIKKNEETIRMEQSIHSLIKTMVDLAVTTEKDLVNCRYDISASQYRVDSWRINLLQNGTFDLEGVLANHEMKDFFFGSFDFSSIALCRMDNDLHEIISLKF